MTEQLIGGRSCKREQNFLIFPVAMLLAAILLALAVGAPMLG
jgi:hypothetical protein